MTVEDLIKKYIRGYKEEYSDDFESVFRMFADELLDKDNSFKDKTDVIVEQLIEKYVGFYKNGYPYLESLFRMFADELNNKRLNQCLNDYEETKNKFNQLDVDRYSKKWINHKLSN